MSTAKVEIGSKGLSTRQRLLATAADLFRRRGYVATTTRDLAAALGMKSASLYHHMGKKEDLLYELSVDALRTIRESQAAALQQSSEPIPRLRALIRAHLRGAFSDQDKWWVLLFELRALGPQRRAEVVGFRDEYEAAVRAAIAEAQALHVLRGDIEPKYLSLALLNLLNWTIFWYRPGGELTEEALADLLTTIFLEGTVVRNGVDSDPESRASDRTT